MSQQVPAITLQQVERQSAALEVLGQRAGAGALQQQGGAATHVDWPVDQGRHLRVLQDSPGWRPRRSTGRRAARRGPPSAPVPARCRRACD